jgi:hypothetical protein
MCPHSRFEIVYYSDGIIIRKCRDCGEIEVNLERWTGAEELYQVLGDELSEGDSVFSARASIRGG